jgi:hypothetical protein
MAGAGAARRIAETTMRRVAIWQIVVMTGVTRPAARAGPKLKIHLAFTP